MQARDATVLRGHAADAAPLLCHRCIIDNGHPSCNFTFDAVARSLGLSQTRRVPAGGTVTFTSCGVYMDEAVVTSPTCFEVSALPMQSYISGSGSEELITSGTRCTA